MAVKYRLFQEQRKTSPNKGKWYPCGHQRRCGTRGNQSGDTGQHDGQAGRRVCRAERVSERDGTPSAERRQGGARRLRFLQGGAQDHGGGHRQRVLAGQEHHRRAPQLPARNPLDGNRQDTPQAVHPGVGGENGRREGRARRRRHFGR